MGCGWGAAAGGVFHVPDEDPLQGADAGRVAAVGRARDRLHPGGEARCRPHHRTATLPLARARYPSPWISRRSYCSSRSPRRKGFGSCKCCVVWLLTGCCCVAVQEPNPEEVCEVRWMSQDEVSAFCAPDATHGEQIACWFAEIENLVRPPNLPRLSTPRASG